MTTYLVQRLRGGVDSSLQVRCVTPKPRHHKQTDAQVKPKEHQRIDAVVRVVFSGAACFVLTLDSLVSRGTTVLILFLFLVFNNARAS